MVEDIRSFKRKDLRKMLEGSIPIHPELDAYIKKQTKTKKDWDIWYRIGTELATSQTEHIRILLEDWRIVTNIIQKFYGESISGY